MQKSDVFLCLLVAVALVFQIWVTLRVRRSAQYDSAQKSAQTKLIWLLPVIGAAVAFSVLEDEDPTTPDRKESR